MKIFLSYGHDSNEPLIERIKDYLSRDAEGNLKHEVWIDTSEIKAGKDWREKITKGVLESDVVLAGLSEHSTRVPGVCRDEISISIGVKGGNIRTSGRTKRKLNNCCMLWSTFDKLSTSTIACLIICGRRTQSCLSMYGR